MKLVYLEFYKCRKRKVLWICAAFLAAQIAWISYGLKDMTSAELSQGWLNLLYNLMLVDAILFPLTAAVLAGRSCEIEHKGSTFKLLDTITTPGRLYGAKLFWGAIHVAGLIFFRTVLLVLLGISLGFPREVPYNKILLCAVLCFAVSFTIYVLQQSLSLFFKNQAIPLIVGIFGSFAGLLSLFFPVWVQKLLLWGYYGVFIVAGMNWDPLTKEVDFYWTSFQGNGLVLLGIYFVGIFLVGRTLFVHKEV